MFYNSFSELHPYTLLAFFCLTAGITMFTTHPIILIISFFCSLLYLISINKSTAFQYLLKICVPVSVIAMIINPLFNHQGATELLLLPGGNSLTLESILYGLNSAVLLSAGLLWFACISSVFSSEKILFLIGRFLPVISLLISMILRFIPLFRKRFEELYSIHLANYNKQINKKDKLKIAFFCFSAVVTYSLENGVMTSVSMRARGYGTAKRTSFDLFIKKDEDFYLITFFFLAGVFILSSVASGNTRWDFYPTISGKLFAPLSTITYISESVLMLTPFVYNLIKEKQWKHIESRI